MPEKVDTDLRMVNERRHPGGNAMALSGGFQPGFQQALESRSDALKIARHFHFYECKQAFRFHREPKRAVTARFLRVSGRFALKTYSRTIRRRLAVNPVQGKVVNHPERED